MLYLKYRIEDNFQWLQDWMRHFPLQTSLTTYSTARRPRLWGSLGTPQLTWPAWETWGPEMQGTTWENLCSLHVIGWYMKGACVGLLASLPGFLCKITSKRTTYCESPLPVFSCHLPAKAELSLESMSTAVKGSFSWIKKPEFEGRWMAKQSLEQTPTTMHTTMLLFSRRQESSIYWRFQWAPKPQGTPFVGASITEKVDGKTSISWAGRAINDSWKE